MPRIIKKNVVVNVKRRIRNRDQEELKTSSDVIDEVVPESSTAERTVNTRTSGRTVLTPGRTVLTPGRTVVKTVQSSPRRYCNITFDEFIW